MEEIKNEYYNVADIFGENVFNDATMRERLPKKTYQKLKETIREGRELDLETADVVAHEMKEWAIEKGATHYTHWFQPLTGVTAEKHDSFITAPMSNGKVLMSFSGKELINVYQEYCQTHSSECEDLLYLHNFDDVVGMTRLLPILSYNEILNGQFAIKETRLESYNDHSGNRNDELYIILENDYTIPKRVSFKIKDFYVSMNGKKTTIRVPILKGTLYYFFENYKDYYYLPKEDVAIHKSVANFVDRDYRERAKASNCYTKKQSSFLPQYSEIMNPEFRKEYKDKVRYFELTTDFISSDIMLRRYVNHIFALCQGFSK